ncbi:MASE1 domain-containing protein [Luteibacter sp. CQ10]|uniref:MASE1 domain-containing protein n=1 Tax=Luteibacter sp. CQ10 TaxID=2805821 RepID=UPI0034A4EF46
MFSGVGGLNLRSNRFAIPFGDHIAVVMAFALVYYLLNLVMFDHWNLMSGLRLGCLLLVPRRYWLALAVGETLPVLEKTISHAHVFGIPWAIGASIPFIVVCMPFFTAVVRRLPLRDADGNLRITTLLSLNVVLAVVITLWTMTIGFLGYSSYPDPVQAWWASVGTFTPSFLISHYLGTLTVVPIVVVVHEYLRRRRRTSHWWPLMHEAFLLVIPYLAIVVATARTDTFAECAFVQLAIVLPLIALTMHHGKRGAALGALLSSVAMTCAFTTELAPATVVAEAFVALVITAALFSTRPFRTVRTFRGFQLIQTRLDRVSFFVERGLARSPWRAGRPSLQAATRTQEKP